MIASVASADRVAVVPLESPGRPAPVQEADQLAADLMAHGHRLLPNADVVARISAGNQGAGPDWAAQLIQSVEAARSALTRLDRAFAVNMARRIGDDLRHRGGGAGGADVLVEWCLLERQLSITASDAAAAARWLDAAVAYGPDIELDPVRHPDEERDLFARRRTALRNDPSSTLTISTVPPGAEVWVDGVRRCESPCTVRLLPGRHFARASSPAHAPAAIEAEFGPGTSSSKRLNLMAAYSGASSQAISAMLSDPSRRAEGASALEPMAHFLEVEHVIALFPEGNQIRILVAPPPTGRNRFGPLVPPQAVPASVAEQLRPILPPEPEKPSPWYAKPGTWIIAGGLIAGGIAGFFIYDSSRSRKTGTITVVNE